MSGIHAENNGVACPHKCRRSSQRCVKDVQEKLLKFPFVLVFQLEEDRSDGDENLVDVCHMMDDCDTSSSQGGVVPYHITPQTPPAVTADAAPRFLSE